MFVNAIDRAALFTRPIHFITRNYGSSHVQPGAGTLFFVNAEGWALTCKHVTTAVLAGDQLLAKFKAFKAELATVLGHKKERQLRRSLEKKYAYTSNATIELHTQFVDCVDGLLNLNVIPHATYDVALIRFHGYTNLRCTVFPVFPKDTSPLKQGRFLCRLGFPFPEFTNFTYDASADTASWTNAPVNAPRFPIEGMVTRHLGNPDGTIWGFEMSTPGLRGQSGGPVVDVDGKVWGIQAATNHLDLDFDVDQEVVRNGLKRRVRDSAFLHVGHCLHVDVLKSFMVQHGVAFREAD